MLSDKEIYNRYEAVRKSGAYNMITDARAAANAAGLTIEEYRYAIKNYTKLREQYGSKSR